MQIWSVLGLSSSDIRREADGRLVRSVQVPVAGATLGGSRMTDIEVFADISCPFTHVGLRRFVELRSRLGRPDVRLRVRAWPLELVNGSPLDPGAVADKVDSLRSQVAPDLFTGFDRSAFPPTTLPALALTSAAYGRDPFTGEQVALALRDLLFEQGVDVADPDVLQGVAGDHGVEFDPGDVRAVLADHAVGVERGVIGSPHFFTSDGSFFCPALDVNKDGDGRLSITADLAGFEEFTAGCFV